MSCKSCGAENETRLDAEMMIHLPGLTNLGKVGVWVFPKILVCLACGFAEFTIEETELRQLGTRVAAQRPAA